MNLLRWYECMKRRQHSFAHVRNIYGDEILLLNARSIWRCTHCGKEQFRQNLAATSVPQACIHDPATPQGCYRVRCQLSARCVELPTDGVTVPAAQTFRATDADGSAGGEV